MKKTFKLIYDEGDYAIYDVEGTPNMFSISGSPLDSWSKPGEAQLVLTDNGNGICLGLHGKSIALDYSESELVRLALKLNSPNASIQEITTKKFRGLK